VFVDFDTPHFGQVEAHDYRNILQLRYIVQLKKFVSVSIYCFVRLKDDRGET